MALRLISGTGQNAKPLALLDLGSSKVACLIVASIEASGAEVQIGAALPVRKLGYGHTRSRGIRAGTITDLAQAEEAVKQAVSQAETEAAVRVDEVVVAVTSGRIQSLNFAASTKPVSGTVASADIDKMLEAGRDFAARNGRQLLHLQRLGFRLDGEAGIRNPRGMTGQKLSLDLNAVTADEANLRNIRNLLARCYLKVAAPVAAPFASALAVLGEQDLQGASAVIDFGAGTTTFAVFQDGLFLHAGAIALGGNQVTLAIARALSIPLIQAERIKALYGNLAGALSDEHEYVPLTQGGNATAGEPKLTRAQLRQIVAPRIDELLQLLRDRIAQGGLGGRGPDRLVLTGGASQLAGLGGTAAQQFGCPARLGWPMAFAGMQPQAANPGAAAVFGLVYASLLPGAFGRVGAAQPAGPSSYAGRLGRWFKDSFWDEEQPAGAGPA